MDAVAALRADPQLAKKAESSVMARYEAMVPLLDKVQQLEASAWAAEEASRNAAADRNAANPNNHLIDLLLTRSIIALLVGLLVVIGVLIGILVFLKADAGIIGTLGGLFASIGGVVVGKFGTRYDYTYGSSRGSAASGAVLREIAARPKE
jgi:hypothetical protein